jgi:hypothetical protein
LNVVDYGGDSTESAKIYPLNRNRFERSLKVSAPPTPPKPKLLDQVRQAIRTRHYSYMTEKAYVRWIKRFIFFHNKRHPAEMAEAEIAQFLSPGLRKGGWPISPVLFARKDQADYSRVDPAGG